MEFEDIRVLQGNCLFRDLPSEAFDWLALKVKVKSAEPGEVFLKEWGPPDAVSHGST